MGRKVSKPKSRKSPRRRKDWPAPIHGIVSKPATLRLHYVEAAQLEEMSPGDIILLEESESLKSQVEPVFCAVLACPACGTRGLVTRPQFSGAEPVICSSDRCSCRFRIVEQTQIVTLAAS